MKNFKFSRKQLVIPYVVFLIVFVIIPLLLILVYALTDKNWNFTLINFVNFFTDISTLSSFMLSIITALATTIICLLIAYPLAYILTKINIAKATILIMLCILPLWINFLLRTLALAEILALLNISKGIFATIIGMVYNFLPFMILPVYNSLNKMDKSLIEASQDLGAKPYQVFFKTIVPLSMPGIISGSMMVFMPTISAFAVSDILTNRDVNFFGTLVNFYFNAGNDLHYGSALSFMMLIIIGVTMLITSKFEKEDSQIGGTLW